MVRDVLSLFYANVNVCLALLCGVGLKDRRVRNQDITASRSYDSMYQPEFARLDRQGSTSGVGGWLGCAGSCGKYGL